MSAFNFISSLFAMMLLFTTFISDTKGQPVYLGDNNVCDAVSMHLGTVSSVEECQQICIEFVGCGCKFFSVANPLPGACNFEQKCVSFDLGDIYKSYMRDPDVECCLCCPSDNPTGNPTKPPSNNPSINPTSINPTETPSSFPTTTPSNQPTTTPSNQPTQMPISSNKDSSDDDDSDDIFGANNINNNELNDESDDSKINVKVIFSESIMIYGWIGVIFVIMVCFCCFRWKKKQSVF